MKTLNKLLGAVIFIALCANTPGFSQHLNTPYEYPIKPGTDEWKNFRTQEAMIAACQIPDKVLNELTTEALAKSCLQYPMFPQINAYNNTQQGFERLASKFNGFKELMNRPGGYTALFQIYKEMNPSGFSKDWSLIERGRFIQKFQYIEMLLSQKAIVSKMDLKSKKALLHECQKKYRTKFEYQDSYSLVGLSHTSYVMINILNSDNAGKSIIDKDLKEFSNTAIAFDASVPTRINSLVEAYLSKN